MIFPLQKTINIWATTNKEEYLQSHIDIEWLVRNIFPNVNVITFFNFHYFQNLFRYLVIFFSWKAIKFGLNHLLLWWHQTSNKWLGPNFITCQENEIEWPKPERVLKIMKNENTSVGSSLLKVRCLSPFPTTVIR